MITLDASTLILLVLAAALAGALIAVLPRWRRMQEAAANLPVRGFLRQRDASLERIAALQAELHCEMCGAKAQCRQLLAEGVISPVPGCPNAELFRDASGKTAAQTP